MKFLTDAPPFRLPVVAAAICRPQRPGGGFSPAFLVAERCFADDSLVGPAVDADPQRPLEAHQPQELSFVERFAGVETVLAEDAVAAERVDGQVTDAQGGDVLEKVGALRGFDVELLDINPAE